MRKYFINLKNQLGERKDVKIVSNHWDEAIIEACKLNPGFFCIGGYDIYL